MAIPRPVPYRLSRRQWLQHFGFEPLTVDIAARLCETFRRTLFGPQEEVVHVQHIAAETLMQASGEHGFAGCSWTVNGDERAPAFGQQPFHTINRGFHAFDGFHR